jgi:hypothetical protein
MDGYNGRSEKYLHNFGVNTSWKMHIFKAEKMGEYTF